MQTKTSRIRSFLLGLVCAIGALGVSALGFMITMKLTREIEWWFVGGGVVLLISLICVTIVATLRKNGFLFLGFILGVPVIGWGALLLAPTRNLIPGG